MGLPRGEGDHGPPGDKGPKDPPPLWGHGECSHGGPRPGDRRRGRAPRGVRADPKAAPVPSAQWGRPHIQPGVPKAELSPNMEHLWGVSGVSHGCPYRRPMGVLWASQGCPYRCPMDAPMVVPMDVPWVSYGRPRGVPTDVPWTPLWLSLWVPQGCPYRCPMGVLWVSYGCPYR